MGMIAWPCHAETPEILVKNEVRKLTSKSPPMLPKMKPIVSIDECRAVDISVFQEACGAEQETLGGRPMITKQLELQSLRQHQKRNLVPLVAESDCEGLKERFVHAVGDGRPTELIRLPLHPDTGSRLDQRIDCPAWQPPERSATATRMGNRGMEMREVNFALQVNL